MVAHSQLSGGMCRAHMICPSDGRRGGRVGSVMQPPEDELASSRLALVTDRVQTERYTVGMEPLVVSARNPTASASVEKIIARPAVRCAVSRAAAVPPSASCARKRAM